MMALLVGPILYRVLDPKAGSEPSSCIPTRCSTTGFS